MTRVSLPSVTHQLGTVAVAVSTAIAIVALAIVPFLTPAWIGFEQGRANATAWTGLAEPDLRAVTNSILADLIVGPPAFDVALQGVQVLSEAERSHMRDVRGVFAAFALTAIVALGVLAVAFGVARRGTGRWDRAAAWRAIRGGALSLAVAIVAVGVVAAVAFDAAFEVFHRLFFSAGSYLFDPRTDRLVQLFPQTFWSETTIAVGVVILALAISTSVVAGRRLAALRRGPAGNP